MTSPTSPFHHFPCIQKRIPNRKCSSKFKFCGNSFIKQSGKCNIIVLKNSPSIWNLTITHMVMLDPRIQCVCYCCLPKTGIVPILMNHYATVLLVEREIGFNFTIQSLGVQFFQCNGYKHHHVLGAVFAIYLKFVSLKPCQLISTILWIVGNT